MNLKLIYIVIIIFFNIIAINADQKESERKYEFSVFNNHDLRNSSINMIGTLRVLNDGFDSIVVTNMSPKVGAISKGIFNFATTYLSMLWSHEFGHLIRANQIGGKFNIHNFGLPIPYTTADLPEDVSLINEAIFVTAGFEVNYLNVQNIQLDFIRNNGIYNEDLAFSFANRLMYPIYTTLIVPIDPKDKNVWVETAGDPIHYILPVFKNYSNNNVFLENDKVNPELVNFYNEASILGLFFNLVDPQFYKEIGAAFGKSDKSRRPTFLIGDYENGWTYGTLFNASPLGYELYIKNYLHIDENKYNFYLKYGRPFKNIGLGFSMLDIIKNEKIYSDLKIDLWDQDIFGFGISTELNGVYRINKKVGLNFNLGYKSEGYLLGKQLSSGPNLGLGISFYNIYTK